MNDRAGRRVRISLIDLMAIVAAAAIATVALGYFSVKWVGSGTFPAYSTIWLTQYFASMLSPIGMSVATAWSFLVVIGLWRPAPDTIDRLGRVVGVYWIAVGLPWGGISSYHGML